MPDKRIYNNIRGKMKSIFGKFVFLAFPCLAYLSVSFGADRDVIYQTAPIKGLSAGLYDGFFSFASLKKFGDFGIGTFHALDGEMVFVDNAFYQVKQDGAVAAVPDSALTPFAEVTFFDRDLRLEPVTAENFTELARAIDKKQPTRNIFYAIRIDGVFDYLKLRSVPAQTKPYPPLAEALKSQTVFEHKNIAGTLVGFRSPSYVEGVSVPGYHFHFIAADRKTGGHVLDLRFKGLAVCADQCAGLLLVWPDNKDFFNAELEPQQPGALKAVE